MAKMKAAVLVEQLEELKSTALEQCASTADHLTDAEGLYEKAVLTAWDLGCGASAIGRAVGLSEGAIRGYVRRRREAA